MENRYAKTPLVKKLGIKEGMNLVFLHEPDEYVNLLGTLPKNITIAHELQHKADFLQFFTRSQESLREIFPQLKNSLSKIGMLWVSWPKGACNIRTDLNENIIRSIGLENGLVDVKICSIDEVWSGLKFVFRLKDR